MVICLQVERVCLQRIYLINGNLIIACKIDALIKFSKLRILTISSDFFIILSVFLHKWDTIKTLLHGDSYMNKNTIPDLVEQNEVEVFGARVHNLKNIDVSFPRNKLVVI